MTYTNAEREWMPDGVTELPWEWWTSNSFRRLSGADGKDGGVAFAFNNPADKHPDICINEQDARYIVTCANEMPRVLALLARYRNETPLGHQPHMIAHEVDALLADLREKLK